MRVILKHPGRAPEAVDLELRAIEKLLSSVESCMNGPGVKAHCDGDGLGKELQLNLIRPSDGAPIVGPVVAFGYEGPYERGLTEREVALWMATLAVTGVDEDESWRASALASLVPLVHDEDRAAYRKLARQVGRAIAANPVPVDFKPSQVDLLGAFPPLVDTFGRTEAEQAAVLLVRTCQAFGDAWQDVEPRAIARVIGADLAVEREPFHGLSSNPFFRPDVHDLVRRGFAEWVGEVGGAMRFTASGLERLRKWVRL